MSFADLELRTTAAAFRHLVNAQATIPPATEPVGVVFDAARGLVDDDMGTQTLGPALLMQPADGPDVAEGQTITIDMPQHGIDAVEYLVRVVQPMAEGGLQRLLLARA